MMTAPEYWIDPSMYSIDSCRLLGTSDYPRHPPSEVAVTVTVWQKEHRGYPLVPVVPGLHTLQTLGLVPGVVSIVLSTPEYMESHL